MAAKKVGPMCVVTIGYQKVLLPAAAGMKVVALLADAMELEYDHGRDCLDAYIVGDPMDVSYKTVQPGKLRLPPDPPGKSPKGQLLLEGRRG